MSLALRVLKSWLSNVLPVRELPDGGSSGGQFLRRRPCNGIKIGLTTGMILGTSGILPSAAWAQQAQPVSIVVAPMTHVAPSSQTQLPIKIDSKDALPRDTFIRIRGLPALVALSEGYATAPGAWSVPLSAAPKLRMIVPVGAPETSNVEISLVNHQGTVFAKATTKLMVIPGPPSAPSRLGVQLAATTPRNLDPSPLAEVQKNFDKFLARKTVGAKSGPTTVQKAEMFRQFLTWPQNPLEVDVTVRLTSPGGVGKVLGTIAVKNGEIVVAGRKESALFLKPNLRGLTPGLYAFHVHEFPNCGPALKEGESVPGLSAGSHLWLSGTGEMSGTTFTSHLGDLPKLEVSADGSATKVVVAARLTLADVANRSFMIHASQDDNSPRLACAPFH